MPNWWEKDNAVKQDWWSQDKEVALGKAVPEQAEEVLQTATDLQVPADVVEQNWDSIGDKELKTIDFAPGYSGPRLREWNPSLWERFKLMFDKPAPLPKAYDTPEGQKLVTQQLGEFREEAPAKTAAWFAARNLWGGYAAGRAFFIPDVLAKYGKGDIDAAASVDRLFGATPTPKEKQIAETIKFFGAARSIAGVARYLGLMRSVPATRTSAAQLAQIIESGKLGFLVETNKQVSMMLTDSPEYEGAVAPLKTGAIFAGLTFLAIGAAAPFRSAWESLMPSEQDRALKLLGLKPGATQEEIKAAFRKKTLQYHPDKAAGLRKEFDEIIEARNTLRDKVKKDVITRRTVRKLLEGPTEKPPEAPGIAQEGVTPAEPTQVAPEAGKAAVGKAGAVAKPKATVGEAIAETAKRFAAEEAGTIDMTPLIKAGPQIQSAAEKLAKITTRFQGLDAPVRETLVAYEEATKTLGTVAKDIAIEKFGHLSEAEERAIEDYRELADKDPERFGNLPEELKADYAEMVRSYDEIGKRLEELGYPADWPKGQIKWLEDKLATLNAAEIPNVGAIEAVEKAIEDITDVGYIHHAYRATPKSKRVRQFFQKKITSRPSGLLGRKYATYQAAEETGLKRLSLSAAYADALAAIMRAEAAEQLIQAINQNPHLSAWAKDAPPDWVTVDENAFPSSVTRTAYEDKKGVIRHRTMRRKYAPPIAEALGELSYVRGRHLLETAYDKVNLGFKLIGFYRPEIMTKNDAIQLWRVAGIKGAFPLLPQVGRTALIVLSGSDESMLEKVFETLLDKIGGQALEIAVNKGPIYDKLRKGGLFNNVVNHTPAASALAQHMIDTIREDSGEKAARLAKQYLNPANFLDNLRSFQEATTWRLDEVMRIAAWLAVKDAPMLEGKSNFEKIEFVNDAMVNYGKLPKETKRWVNKAFFVPNYRIGNFRFFWGQLAQEPWRFKGPILRTIGYKLFIQYGLPTTVATAVYMATGERRDVRAEKGYKIVIHNPKTNADTVFSLSDPLLEGAKITQRPISQTLFNNLSAGLNIIVRSVSGPRRKDQEDIFGEFFKLGTPFWRDLLLMKSEDKTRAEKTLTFLTIAYVYHRQGRMVEEQSAISSIAKALSLWTDWKEQAADIQRIITGRTAFYAPGGPFGKLLRQYEIEQDISATKQDKHLDNLLRRGKDEEAIKYAMENELYKTPDGYAGRVVRMRAPLVYTWEVLPPVEQVKFMKWLKEKGYPIDYDAIKSKKTVGDALPEFKKAMKAELKKLAEAYKEDRGKK